MKIIQYAFVCYPTKDMKKSREFYEGVLGLVPNGEYTSDEFTEYNIGESALAIGNMEGFDPSKGGGCAVFEVDDFDDAVKELEGKGVKFVMGPMETGVCHMAQFNDPDGNSLMIHRRKAK
jgi:predicted enzyme related to lactoylglutathione lyase